jgi:hypothetical protein
MIAFLFLLGVEWDGGSIIILSTIVIEEIRALPHFAPSPGHAHGDAVVSSIPQVTPYAASCSMFAFTRTKCCCAPMSTGTI